MYIFINFNPRIVDSGKFIFQGKTGLADFDRIWCKTCLIKNLYYCTPPKILEPSAGPAEFPILVTKSKLGIKATSKGIFVLKFGPNFAFEIKLFLTLEKNQGCCRLGLTLDKYVGDRFSY